MLEIQTQKFGWLQNLIALTEYLTDLDIIFNYNIYVYLSFMIYYLIALNLPIQGLKAQQNKKLWTKFQSPDTEGGSSMAF